MKRTEQERKLGIARCLDAGDKFYDRYSILLTTKRYGYATNDRTMQNCLCVGSDGGTAFGSAGIGWNAGKRIAFDNLPANVQSAIVARLTD